MSNDQDLKDKLRNLGMAGDSTAALAYAVLKLCCTKEAATNSTTSLRRKTDEKENARNFDWPVTESAMRAFLDDLKSTEDAPFSVSTYDLRERFAAFAGCKTQDVSSHLFGKVLSHVDPTVSIHRPYKGNSGVRTRQYRFYPKRSINSNLL